MQFISMDSYDLANRYAYCDGNPIGNEDPTGHNPFAMSLIPGYGLYEAYKDLKNGNYLAGVLGGLIGAYFTWDSVGLIGLGVIKLGKKAIAACLKDVIESPNLTNDMLLNNEYPKINIQAAEEKHTVRLFDYDDTLLVNGEKNNTLAKELPENVLTDRNNIILTQGSATKDRLNVIQTEWGDQFKYKKAYGYYETGQSDGSKFNIIETLNEIKNNDNINTIVLYDDRLDRHISPYRSFNQKKLNPKRQYYFGHVQPDKITYYKFDFIQEKFIQDLYNGGKIIS